MNRNLFSLNFAASKAALDLFSTVLLYLSMEWWYLVRRLGLGTARRQVLFLCTSLINSCLFPTQRGRIFVVLHYLRWLLRSTWPLTIDQVLHFLLHNTRELQLAVLSFIIAFLQGFPPFLRRATQQLD